VQFHTVIVVVNASAHLGLLGSAGPRRAVGTGKEGGSQALDMSSSSTHLGIVEATSQGPGHIGGVLHGITADQGVPWVLTAHPTCMNAICAGMNNPAEAACVPVLLRCVLNLSRAAGLRHDGYAGTVTVGGHPCLHICSMPGTSPSSPGCKHQREPESGLL
jgi:hypothetical protein